MKQPKSFLFVTIEGGGNIPPMLGLAKRLLTRGHTVRVLTEPCLADAVQAYGLEFIAFEQYFTRTDRNEIIFHDYDVSPNADPTLKEVVFGPAKVVVQETRRVLQQFPSDVLVVDCLLPPALMAAESLHIPGVIVFHMPEYMGGPNRPPGFMGLLPGKGIFGRIRDRLLGKLFDRMMNKFLPTLNEVRHEYGLEPLTKVADILNLADRRLIQTLKSFDFPIEPAPQNVRYTGPILDDPDWAGQWQNPWSEEDTRPLVVISLSSTFQNQGAAIQRCLDALAGLNVRGLLTLGPAMEAEKFHIPDNVVMLASAPHSQVFPQADLLITHAGHGTLMRALANGLPIICLPMGRDQNDNAAKVAYQGCGIKLKKKVKPDKIRRAITRILEDSSYRQQARRLQEAVRADAEKERAVYELELLAGSHSSRPVTGSSPALQASPL